MLASLAPATPQWNIGDHGLQYLPNLNIYSRNPKQDHEPYFCGATSWTGANPYHDGLRLQYAGTNNNAEADAIMLMIVAAAEIADTRAPFWMRTEMRCGYHYDIPGVVHICGACIGGAGHPNLRVPLPDGGMFELVWNRPELNPEYTTMSHPLTEDLRRQLIATLWHAVAQNRNDVVGYVTAGVVRGWDASYEGVFRNQDQAELLFLDALGLGA